MRGEAGEKRWARPLKEKTVKENMIKKSKKRCDKYSKVKTKLKGEKHEREKEKK